VNNPVVGLFGDVKKFKFEDGNAFDTRGLPTHTASGRAGTFGDTNERAKKGFASTFAMPRDFGGVLKLKLDWFFVKPLEQPVNEAAPGASSSKAHAKNAPPLHLFEPYFPVAMQSLSDSVDDRAVRPLSDDGGPAADCGAWARAGKEKGASLNAGAGVGARNSRSAGNGVLTQPQ
jgi:hypothetical protein